jgi:glutamate-1-semialdehyde 2,1-aminomutase
MAAGIATLEHIQKAGFYEDLDQKAAHLLSGLEKAAQKAAIPVQTQRVGSMLGFFFNDRTVHNFADAKTSDLEKFAAFYAGMRQAGIYIAPSQFEALFISAAHQTDHIEATLEAAERVLAELK